MDLYILSIYELSSTLFYVFNLFFFFLALKEQQKNWFYGNYFYLNIKSIAI
jgi:hypothetical protein